MEICFPNEWKRWTMISHRWKYRGTDLNECFDVIDRHIIVIVPHKFQRYAFRIEYSPRKWQNCWYCFVNENCDCHLIKKVRYFCEPNCRFCKGSIQNTFEYVHNLHAPLLLFTISIEILFVPTTFVRKSYHRILKTMFRIRNIINELLTRISG